MTLTRDLRWFPPHPMVYHHHISVRAKSSCEIVDFSAYMSGGYCVTAVLLYVCGVCVTVVLHMCETVSVVMFYGVDDFEYASYYPNDGSSLHQQNILLS